MGTYIRTEITRTTVRIPTQLHTEWKILAAQVRETMDDIAERALRNELERMRAGEPSLDQAQGLREAVAEKG